jgi:hypothetical protein
VKNTFVCDVTRLRAKREKRQILERLILESQGQNLAATVLHLLYPLDSAIAPSEKESA